MLFTKGAGKKNNVFVLKYFFSLLFRIRGTNSFLLIVYLIVRVKVNILNKWIRGVLSVLLVVLALGGGGTKIEGLF